MATTDVRQELLKMRAVAFWEAEIRRTQSRGDEFLVARQGRHTLGFVGSVYGLDDQWELVWLFVIPEAVGRGVGSELYKAILAGSTRAPSVERFLWAVPGNSRAERFYADRGWQPTTRTKDVETPAGTFPLRKWILPA